MSKSTKNPLSIRAKGLITDAFFELIEEKQGQKITISALCQRAGVARRTFYTHYDKIEDIPRQHLTSEWLSALEEKINECIEAQSPLNKFNSILTEFTFNYWGKQAGRFSLLKSAGLETVLIDVIHAGVLQCRQLSGPIAGEMSAISNETLLQFLISFETNAWYKLLSLWIDTGMEQSTDEMAKFAQTLVNDNALEKLIQRFGEDQ